MKTAIILGGLGAFATGILISLQAYLSGRAGTLVGSIRTNVSLTCQSSADFGIPSA